MYYLEEEFTEDWVDIADACAKKWDADAKKSWLKQTFEDEAPEATAEAPQDDATLPGIVSVIVDGVIALLVLHAILAMRKFPANYRQYRAFIGHRRLLAHEDTTLWWVQVITGFALFFLATVHLYQMLMHPGDIGPFESADRVWSGRWWPIYLVMLFCVELHGGVGLYRLAVKWGWFEGKDANASRKRLKLAKWALTVFFLVLGLATLAAYIKIGYEHRDRVGERYVPTYLKAPEAPR